MAMTMQSPVQLDSLSNGFMGMSLNTSRPAASQVSAKPCTTIRMAIKRWERKEVKENSLPVTQKLHVKIGDTVKVIAGHDKGKISTVTQLYTHNSKIVLKDVNLKTKHVKGKGEGETGQIVQVEAPIHSSNVMLYSKTAKVASRVGHKTLEDGSRVRYLLKTGEVLDSAEDWKKVHKKKEEKKE